MKSLCPVALVLVTLAAAPSLAKYSPPPLFDMVGSSDLVLVGTIAEVGETTFVLQVETVVAGKFNGKTIEVKRFKDWTCAVRWTPYAEKQRVLLCLTTAAGKPATIRSSGGEGEMPIADGFVHYRGYPIDTIAPAGPQTIGDKTIHGQKVKLGAFVSAIQGYRRCFRLELKRGKWPRLESVEQTTTDAEVEALEASSPIAAFLVKTARNSRKFKNPKPTAWTRSALLAITDAKARELGYELETMSVAFNTYNTQWKRYVGALKDSPPTVPALEGRTFWAVYYGPLKRTLGGDLWVFVDRETRKILAIRRGQ